MSSFRMLAAVLVLDFGPEVFVRDGTVPRSAVDFTGPKGVLQSGGIVT